MEVGMNLPKKLEDLISDDIEAHEEFEKGESNGVYAAWEILAPEIQKLVEAIREKTKRSNYGWSSGPNYSANDWHNEDQIAWATKLVAEWNKFLGEEVNTNKAQDAGTLEYAEKLEKTILDIRQLSDDAIKNFRSLK
jgi:hypothetical protein